ncbi:MAG: hypothetical protein J6S78_05365 [Lachnospiraceae bacterium]|nr:hypothetical protein [Lachnospiraceae bacterium]
MGRIWNLGDCKEKKALIDEYGNEMTYGELADATGALASKIGHRCLVFVLCRNEIGSVTGYVACVNNGIVPVMLNSHLDAVLLSQLTELYKPEYIWCPKEQVSQFEGMLPEYEAYN